MTKYNVNAINYFILLFSERAWGSVSLEREILRTLSLRYV